jgi:hypothetical protein
MSNITIPRAIVQQALEALEGCVKALDALNAPGDSIYTRASDLADRAEIALRAALAQQEQTCNCRWVGDVQTQQCTLHEAHVDAIHEWAERAKAAEAKLAALAQQEQEPRWLTKELMADYLDMIAEAIEHDSSETLRHKAYWMRNRGVE